jgi:hypothetical protein
MSKNKLPLIVAGVGVLYLMSRRSPVYGGAGTTVPGSGAYSVPGVGSLVTGLTNFIGSLFHPGVTYGNPGINVVSNPGAYPNTPPDYGGYATDSGNPCDSASVQYNPDICAELGG